jgi:tryptophan synthase beta subunit
MKLAPGMAKDQIIVMNLCGRGDKDIFTVAISWEISRAYCQWFKR